MMKMNKIKFSVIKKSFFILLILITALNCSSDDDMADPDPDPEAQYYTNPMYLPQQSRAIGIGDPSSIRWMGKYYMTVSRNPADIGVQMWESDNLVNWEYIGTVSNAPELRDAWAPEIMYYEGNFYLYTSGPDQNHRALKLETSSQQKPSPFGAYNVFSTNFFPKANHDIDGSPFRDDDGSMYFTFSGIG